MNVSRRAAWGTVTVFALVALATAWFLSTHDREYYETRGRPKPQAIRNSWLATEMLLSISCPRVAPSSCRASGSTT
jgi:hypothetical protein